MLTDDAVWFGGSDEGPVAVADAAGDVEGCPGLVDRTDQTEIGSSFPAAGVLVIAGGGQRAEALDGDQPAVRRARCRRPRSCG